MVSWIFLLLFWCFFLEQSTIFKKKWSAEIDINQISLLTMIATAVCSGVVLWVKSDRHYELTLVSFLLLIFQILGAVIFSSLSNKAIHHAERSTFSVMSTMSIPLLLLSDIVFGYGVTIWQIIGVSVLVIMLSYAIFKGDFSTKGMKYIIASNIVSLGTTIAFKYSTSHFGSTELVNFYNAIFAGLLFFIIVSRTKGWKGIKNTFKSKYLGFAMLYGVGGVLSAAAYKYMIASMVIALKRFFAMMFGVITWKLFFHEKNTLKKLSVASIVGVGVAIMNIWPLLSSFFVSSSSSKTHASAPLPDESEKIYIATTLGMEKEIKRSKQEMLF